MALATSLSGGWREGVSEFLPGLFSWAVSSWWVPSQLHPQGGYRMLLRTAFHKMPCHVEPGDRGLTLAPPLSFCVALVHTEWGRGAENCFLNTWRRLRKCQRLLKGWAPSPSLFFWKVHLGWQVPRPHAWKALEPGLEPRGPDSKDLLPHHCLPHPSFSVPTPRSYCVVSPWL